MKYIYAAVEVDKETGVSEVLAAFESEERAHQHLTLHSALCEFYDYRVIQIPFIL